jgi:predicted ATPase
MWTRISLKNFKGYKDTGELALRPLTILIGPNGGGKSTLLQFLMALKQTAESTDTSTTLITSIDKEKSGYVDLGLYKDYVYMGEVERSVEFFLGWDAPNGAHAKERQPATVSEPRARAIALQLDNKRPGNQVVVKSLSYYAQDHIADDAVEPLVRLERLDKAAYEAHLPAEWQGSTLKQKNREYEPQKFYRFSPQLLGDLPSDTEARLREYASEVEIRLLNTFYLGPLREQPQRYYVATGERPNDLGIKGQRIGTVLYAEAEGDLIQQTSLWLRRLGIAESVSLSRLAKGNIFHLNIHGKNQRQNVNIADFGFGASQILPVIVESLYAPPGSTLLVEQPEIHLNAHQQLELPNFFAEMFGQGQGKQAIVETHSEYFLKRISTLVAKGQLDPERVIVYYCHADQDGSHIEPITLDEKGRYAWWPEDFLAEGYEGSVEHMDAMQATEPKA